MNVVCGSVSQIIGMYTSADYLDCSGRLDFIQQISWTLDVVLPPSKMKSSYSLPVVVGWMNKGETITPRIPIGRGNRLKPDVVSLQI